MLGLIQISSYDILRFRCCGCFLSSVQCWVCFWACWGCSFCEVFVLLPSFVLRCAVMLCTRYISASVWVQFHVTFRAAQFKEPEELLATIVLQWLIATEIRINRTWCWSGTVLDLRVVYSLKVSFFSCLFFCFLVSIIFWGFTRAISHDEKKARLVILSVALWKAPCGVLQFSLLSETMTHMQFKWFHTIPVIGKRHQRASICFDGAAHPGWDLFVNVKLNVFKPFVSSCSSWAHL